MPQPKAVQDLQEPLLAAYRRAWEQVEQQQRALVDDPLRATRRKRLLAMQRQIERSMTDLDDTATSWIASRLPQVYALGGAEGADAAGSSFAWSQVHQEAVQRLADGLFDELLGATSHVGDTTKQLVRAIARDEGLQAAIAGRTAKQASTEMRRILETKGISAVTYKDGSVHGLREYAQMAVRTTSAKAYNSGTLNGAANAGVTFWEILDGPECGLSFHDDPTLALGLVVDKDTAEQYLISHPNCRRAFGARPDVTSKEQAKEAGGSIEPGQTEAQREQDQVRREQARRVSQAKARRTRREADKGAARPERQRRAAPHRTSSRSASFDITNPELAAETAQRAWAGEFVGTDGTIFRTSVDFDPRVSGSTAFVTVRDANGVKIGESQRLVRERGQAIDHEILKLKTEYQGLGFSRAFNAQAEEVYREAGVKQIRLTAEGGGGYNGGYTWARAGYDWRDLQQWRRTDLWGFQGEKSTWSRIASADKVPAMSDSTARAWADLVRRAEEAERLGNRDSMPTPFEFSELGRDQAGPDATMWLGKWLMMRSTWRGVRFL